MECHSDSDGASGPNVDGRMRDIFTKKTSLPVDLPVAPPPEAEVYDKRKVKGTAIIFNHRTFTIDHVSTRDGTDLDRDALQNVLQELTFDVLVYDDLTLEKILEVLSVVSKMNHTECECLIIAVMSHGDEGIIYARDQAYPTKKLWSYFTPIRCPSLAGKPKMFFIQACRGSESDPGQVVTYVEKDSRPTSSKTYTIPIMADIIVMYATVEEYYAWRDPATGSYFIQALVNQLRKHHQSEDLLSILTRVNREVAIGFSSFEPNYPKYNNKKEMCSIVSMLTRKYYFNL
ncbi:caspase-like [Diabrotica virgifera virgifera]|uniref:Caspase-1-like n=2 Tax=Diabrotica virgifera virgifera TaxID=50390 RepID=A0ABM5L8X1_DIAVI|nr:caspase-like [Diabrotica virgifera virgifera]